MGSIKHKQKKTHRHIYCFLWMFWRRLKKKFQMNDFIAKISISLFYICTSWAPYQQNFPENNIFSSVAGNPPLSSNALWLLFCFTSIKILTFPSLCFVDRVIWLGWLCQSPGYLCDKDSDCPSLYRCDFCTIHLSRYVVYTVHIRTCYHCTCHTIVRTLYTTE